MGYSKNSRTGGDVNFLKLYISPGKTLKNHSLGLEQPVEISTVASKVNRSKIFNQDCLENFAVNLFN